MAASSASPDAESLPSIWVLADDRTGNANQCRGLASKLGLPFHTKRIRYNSLARLPNRLLPASFKTLDLSDSDPLVAPWPDLVIAAGRRTAPIARAIKRKSRGKTRLIQLMDPQSHHRQFDLLLIPEHDTPPPRANQQLIHGALHGITPMLLADARNEWEETLTSLPAPHFALIVGGSTGHGAFTPEHAANLAAQVNRLCDTHNASLFITSSRRTGEAALKALMESLSVTHHLFKWTPTTLPAENPYLGFLALADRLIITGESVSMISEALSTGTPVQLFDEGEFMSPKHRRYVESLYQAGYASPLANAEFAGNHTPYDEAVQVAEQILRDWFDRGSADISGDADETTQNPFAYSQQASSA